jgi:hypothetical protein
MRPEVITLLIVTHGDSSYNSTYSDIWGKKVITPQTYCDVGPEVITPLILIVTLGSNKHLARFTI